MTQKSSPSDALNTRVQEGQRTLWLSRMAVVSLAVSWVLHLGQARSRGGVSRRIEEGFWVPGCVQVGVAGSGGVTGVGAGGDTGAQEPGGGRIGEADSGSVASIQSNSRSCSASWHFLHSVTKLLC